MLGCNLLFSFFSVSFSTLVFLVFSPLLFKPSAIYVINIIIVITQVSAVRADEGAAGAYLMTSLVHLPSCILWLLFLYSSRCLFSSDFFFLPKSLFYVYLCVLLRVFFLWLLFRRISNATGDELSGESFHLIN